ncbi:MAG: hypothetical protein LBL45_10625 [Treponema sp.]|nr:hypothetical protein [Treponema sp.]
MPAYYYLIPQLPSLNYNAPLPMTSQAFIELCKRELSPSDTSLLDLCTLNPDIKENAPASSSAFIEVWSAWERTLRLNLARYRSLKLKREGGTAGGAYGAAGIEPPAYPADAAAAAKAAFAIESPLEAELFLDQARWNAIESLQGLSYFGENAVYAYLLKLRLLERKALFKAEEGFAEYTMLYAAILDGQRS